MTLTRLVVAVLLQTAPAARVGIVNGQVDLVRPGGTIAAHTGDVLQPGDRVRTPKGASLTLYMESGATLYLRSETGLELKTVDGVLIPLITEGSLNVRSFGKPARIETRFGRIAGTEGIQEFDVSYSGDVVQVLLIGGSVRAEVVDSSKIVFKNAYDSGVRVYEAGSISEAAPQEKSGTTVIAYPSVDQVIPRGVVTGHRGAPSTPPVSNPRR